ncbi:hypothetical protein LOD99_7413 [Oopsacas minuta]|uniref:Mos1 transposase HTH domain-containing protein n=1 Tax=Oopsacas minuta TaxID=111878 RepID=A0AAV7JUY2_9METZ|nr:hypothetical protein LOD99_7413 [Oopsacas minuta]
MENSEDGKRCIIWFLWKQNKSESEILYEIEKVYGNKCPGKSMVYKWIDRFNDGHSTVDDNPRPGRPKTCSNQENIKIISNILDKDRRVTLQQLEEELGMSKSILDKILTEQLGMSRVLSRWVPNCYLNLKGLKGFVFVASSYGFLRRSQGSLIV